MFKLMLFAKSMPELRAKALEAVNGMIGPEDTAIIEREEVREMYDEAPVRRDDGRGDVRGDISGGGAVDEHPAPSTHEEAAQPSNAEVDANGLPYDKRIHSETRAKNKDETWRYRRNVDKDLVAKVEAELKAKAVVAPTPVATSHDDHRAVSQRDSAPAVPGLPPLPSAPASQPVEHTPPPIPQAPVAADLQKPAHSFQTFKDTFFVTIGNLIKAKKIDQEWLSATREGFGVENIWDLKKDETKLRDFFDQLVAYDLITRID